MDSLSIGQITWLWPRLDLHIVHGLHQPRRGHQKGGVADAARGGDDLPAAARQGLGRDLGAQDLELDVADGLVAQRALPGAPLETLQGGGKGKGEMQDRLRIRTLKSGD